MSKERKNIEFEQLKEEKGKQFSFRNLINGNVLTQKVVIRQAPFLALLVILSLLIIANRNHAEKLVIQSNEIQGEVKELRSKAITTSSELMMVSMQSRVELLIKERNLQLIENKEPLKQLIVEDNN